MKKSTILVAALLFAATAAWGQSPERNMVTEGLISGMEATIGDLSFDQEDQFINAFNKYVKDSRQATATTKKQVLLDYQAEVKRIVTPQKYAILSQNPSMKRQAAFMDVPSTN